MKKLVPLEKILDYTFDNNLLLQAALSHRSVGNQNNERLEFLGDSILNFVIAAELFDRYPKAHEGELSRLRASLVNGETLAELAHEFSVGDFLKLGPGELKSGGFRRKSILADALEAIIGAIYLDSGLIIAQQKILKWFTPRLDSLSELLIPKDAKTQLQEYLQAQKFSLPTYKVLKIIGKAHAQIFLVECRVPDSNYVTEAKGTSRRQAEQLAAKEMWSLLMAEKK